jgi:hypothetical protein
MSAKDKAAIVTPIILTPAIRILVFTAALIFSQNMFTVTSQIAVGDWEFWIDWKDFAWAPFLYTFAVATHFPVYSLVFYRFFKVRFGSTMVLMFWFIQRLAMVNLFFVGMNNYPFNYVQLPSYLLPAIVSDLALFLFDPKYRLGLYVLVSATLAGAAVVPGHFLFLNVPFLMTNVVYPDPVNASTTYTFPIWYLIRMVIPKAPIPAYISELWSWPLPYKSYYNPAAIMTGSMAIMGAVWSGPAYFFAWAIFKGYEKTIKNFA